MFIHEYGACQTGRLGLYAFACNDPGKWGGSGLRRRPECRRTAENVSESACNGDRLFRVVCGKGKGL